MNKHLDQDIYLQLVRVLSGGDTLCKQLYLSADIYTNTNMYVIS